MVTNNVDECATGEHNCLSSEYCIDSVGSYECECREGYDELENGTCLDQNECALNSTICEPLLCVNVPGDFFCQETVHNFC